MKTQVLFILFFLAIQSFAFAQKSKPSATATKPVDFTIPLTPEKWDFQAGKVDFVDYKGQKSMKLAPNSGQVVLKDWVFKDGTIEFDVELILPEFAQSIYFHRKDEKEQEIVYLRVGTIGNKLTNNAIQYTPYFDAINMWDMYPQYQGPAPIKGGDWNHIKLVISGHQMRVYMNNQAQPVLEIPKLEGNLTEGSIAFEGASYIANLQIKPNETEGLTPQEGVDLSNHETNYLRKWAISSPTDLPPGSEAFLGNQPKAEQFTDSIHAERAGFINLTRKFGGNKSRKVVWLKTKIMAKENVKTKLQLGFSDEVWVFLNKQTVFVDKNLFQQAAMRKYPEGRMSKDNASFDINLKPGENELLIAIANDFYGWGIVARLESTEGITGIDEVGSVVKLAVELANLDVAPYVGVYSNPGVNFKFSFSKKDKTLLAKAEGKDEFAMQAMGNHTFRLDQFGVVIEFKPGEKKLLLKQGGDVKEFVRE
ncbi:hypothetical protein [Haliscomenobacter hydrossis]|uniref:3-keto-disaccharide hydrolase domain-containing protein n=1 Tax=Haliscomenobacter hydrossis (strain ATCC 27775 / DSM 1100 / LMG 10767 / O) TaxID=760192 RepID=F4KSB4_HALH1|nr:hypothetical protein [Haliscomenobacter hydrossis]AEE53317.1 hypothetical protein Halhy_5492 [Haliscomenobacter hydrossis DSM 1100]